MSEICCWLFFDILNIDHLPGFFVRKNSGIIKISVCPLVKRYDVSQEALFCEQLPYMFKATKHDQNLIVHHIFIELSYDGI